MASFGLSPKSAEALDKPAPWYPIIASGGRFIAPSFLLLEISKIAHSRTGRRSALRSNPAGAGRSTPTVPPPSLETTRSGAFLPSDAISFAPYRVRCPTALRCGQRHPITGDPVDWYWNLVLRSLDRDWDGSSRLLSFGRWLGVALMFGCSLLA